MNPLQSLVETYPIYRIGVTLGAFVLYLLLRKLSSQSIFKRALAYSFDKSRILFINRIFRVVISITFLVTLAIIWNISLEGISIYVASFLTVVGVGLFATWSIVSNITASVILFFFFPFKEGSKVKILDGDNSVEGTVHALSLFSIKIKLEDNTEIYYPNNLAIQKGIIHLNQSQD